MDGHQDKGSQQHPHPCSRGPHSLSEVQSLQSPLPVSPLFLGGSQLSAPLISFELRPRAQKASPSFPVAPDPGHFAGEERRGE